MVCSVHEWLYNAMQVIGNILACHVTICTVAADMNQSPAETVHKENETTQKLLQTIFFVKVA